MNCRAFTAPVGFERRGYPRVQALVGRFPHGGLHGEGHEVQVAVAGQGPWLSVPAVWPGFVGGPPIFSAGARREGDCSGVESWEPGGGARRTPGRSGPGVMNTLVRGWLATGGSV